MSNDAPRLVAHLEQRLGPIQRGWTHDENDAAVPFTVAKMTSPTTPDLVSYATLGLGRFPLHGRRGNEIMSMEFVVSFRSTTDEIWAPKVLQLFGQAVIESGKALLRGNVIGPFGRTFGDDSPFRWLYASSPVYWDDQFAACRENGRDIVIVWLVPISDDEAGFVRSHGWPAFEDGLIDAQPDLYDLQRRSIPLR